MEKAYSFRFYPTPEQESLLRRTLGCVRLVYNKALHERTQAWYERQERVGYVQTSSMLTDWKKHPEKFLGKPKIIKYKDKTKGRNLLIYSQESIYKKPLKEGICHLSMSGLKMTTSRREIIEVRIVPKSSCYVIEIVYQTK